MKSWFITGATSGLGLELTKAVLEAGGRVTGTGRNLAALEDLKARHPATLNVARLDVTKPEDIGSAIDGAVAAFGRVDVLVNNAGYGLMGVVEDVSDAQISRVFATNLFGPLAIIRHALPLLRKQGSGHIINVSSVGGQTTSASVGLYSATKFGLEGLSQALAEEVAGFGIKVTVVEPGALATGFGAAVDATPFSQPYAAIGDSVAALLETMIPADPAYAARAIMTIADADDPPLRLALGLDAVTAIRRELQARLASLEAWEALSTGATSAA